MILSTLALPLLGAVSAHPNSFSMSEIHVWGNTARVELRVQVLSLGEVVEGFDDDLNGHAEDGEIEKHQAEILEYVQAHYRLLAGPGTDGKVVSPDEALAPRVARAVEGPLALDPMNEVSEWVDVVLEYDLPEAGAQRLGVMVDLFADTSPGHTDSAAVTWNGLELGPWMFNAEASGHLFEPTEEMLARNAPAFDRFLRSVPGRLRDHWQLGLLGLLMVLGAAARLRSPLLSTLLLGGAIASGIAFTHLIPERFELAGFAALTVPLGLAYLGLDEVLHREGRTRLLEPLVFGGVAGIGIALGLAPEVATELDQDGARLGAALGFGGALFAGALVLSLLLAALFRDPERDAFSARLLRLAAALPALGLGAWGFIQGI